MSLISDNKEFFGSLLQSVKSQRSDPDKLSKVAQQLTIKCSSNRNIEENCAKNVIKSIGYLGNYFNLELARFLIYQIRSKESVLLIIKTLNKIYKDIVICQNPGEAIEAYNYMECNPLFRNKIPSLKTLKTEITISNTGEFKNLSRDAAKISSRLAKLSYEIQMLEIDIRQPLELYNLRDEYEKLSKEYKEITNKQQDYLMKLER